MVIHLSEEVINSESVTDNKEEMVSAVWMLAHSCFPIELKGRPNLTGTMRLRLGRKPLMWEGSRIQTVGSMLPLRCDICSKLYEKLHSCAYYPALVNTGAKNSGWLKGSGGGSVLTQSRVVKPVCDLRGWGGSVIFKQEEVEGENFHARLKMCHKSTQGAGYVSCLGTVRCPEFPAL